MKIEVDNEWPIGYGILKLVGIYSHLTVIYKKQFIWKSTIKTLPYLQIRKVYGTGSCNIQNYL